MNWRNVAIRAGSVCVNAGVAWVQWMVTTPGEMTFIEWRIALLLGGVSLIVTLSATWVSRGGALVDTDPDPQRAVRPPWS